ncbi:hypothetical protein SAMN05444420_101342 [Capnocytophaga granulosa]|uniref:Uncharacterized protein n=1 Tax=Capnocytophaga granulosa TaxID=45242 RepID=A0A1H2R499_9FLAO|nr:hypothetical protein [Capnocytophaga granulosa]EPD29923.1 hypothetical protein HMPREF9331_00556 [Capnocytophaga granulosa ATCC 51502]SDW14292.1 hypothetical protein SAMN05444420_101342 [Capnocytophaga granulosa]SUX21472.1 Uncharacterised protein [Capnocytophaga granulosa]
MSPIEKNVSSPDATVELTPELKRLEKANNSLKIVKEMSLLGVSSGVKSVRNILLLVIVNFVFLLGGIYLLFSDSFAYKKLFFLLLIIAVGILFVFIAIKKVFDLLKLEYSFYLFNQFKSYIHKIFEAIFKKTTDTAEKVVSKKQLNEVFHRFIPKIPKAFQKPLLFVLSFTPMVGFVADIYATDNLNSHEKQSDALYEKVKLYLENSVKEERNGYWLIWALLINGLLQGVLLYWLR